MKAPLKNYGLIALLLSLLLGGTCFSQSNPSSWHLPGNSPVGFEPEINAFLKQDSASFPPEGIFLFTGSSTIRKWENLAADFQEIPVIQRGFGGSTMKALDCYAGYIVLPYKPRTIVVYEGDNDLAAGTKPAEFIALCDTFIGRVHRALPRTKIWFMSVKPSFARKTMLPVQDETNRQLKKLIRHRRNTGFIDIRPLMYDRKGNLVPSMFESDSLHVNKDCYRIWAAHMKQVMKIVK